MSKSFTTGNSGVLDPRADRVGGAGGQLELGQAQQELDEGLVGRGGVPRQLLELSAHRRQAQLPEMGLEQLDRDIGHRHGPFLEDSNGDGRARPSGPADPDQAKNTLTGISVD